MIVVSGPPEQAEIERYARRMRRDVEIQLGLSQISWRHSRYGLMPRVAMSGLIRRLQGSTKVFDRDPGLGKVLAKLLDVLL